VSQHAVVFAVGLILAPLAGAQEVKKVSHVGVLLYLYPPDAGPPQAFHQSLRDLGYVDGENVAIDWRYTQEGESRLRSLAVELVRLKPDVIVADGTLAVRAALHTTSTIPIVMIGSADPVGLGLVASLAARVRTSQARRPY
jgi:putative ABC transport system substrate-binding protein